MSTPLARSPTSRARPLPAAVVAIAVAAALACDQRPEEPAPAAIDPDAIRFPALRPGGDAALGRAKLLHRQALAALRARDRDTGGARAAEALAAYGDAGAIVAELSGLSYELVVLWTDAGRLADAERQARDWLRRFPGDALHRLTLGKLLFRRGRYGDAARELEAARALTPGDVSVQRRLVEAYCFEGARDAALRAVDSLLATAALAPAAEASAPARDGEVETLAVAARAFSRFQEPGRAVPLWERLCALRPGDASARLELGAALKSLGQYERALGAMAPVHDDPRLGAEACLESASCHAKVGRHLEAARLLVTALEKDAALAPAYHQLADSLRRLGHVDGASAMAQAAAALQGSQRERARVAEHRAAGRPAAARAAQALAWSMAGRFDRADEALQGGGEPDAELDWHRARFYLDWLRAAEAEAILARLQPWRDGAEAGISDLRRRAQAMLGEPPGAAEGSVLELRARIARTPWPGAAPHLVALGRRELPRDREQARMAARLACAADPTLVDAWKLLAGTLASPAELFLRREALAHALSLAPGDDALQAALAEVDALARSWTASR